MSVQLPHFIIEHDVIFSSCFILRSGFSASVLQYHDSTTVQCQVSWNGCTVEFEVNASTSYAQLRDAACDFFRLKRGDVALLTAQGRYGVRLRDPISVNAMELITRDCVEDSGLDAPTVPLYPWDR